MMRVFVTGATGFIGSAIIKELIVAGHQVLGLVRSDESAAAIAALGAEAHRGELDNLDSLQSAAAASDGVIHTAFIHDFSDYAGAGKTDCRVVEAIGEALAGSDRPFVITSVITVLAPGRLGMEDDALAPNSVSAVRIPSEEEMLEIAARGVRASVVRLPPSVHGDGDRAFVPALIDIARKKGVSAYVGDGSNRWPAVHRLDAAHLFRLAMEKAPAGSRLHGVADEGVSFRDIAGVIGRRLNLPIAAVSTEEATDHFGWLTPFVSIDAPTSSTLTQERLGWHPVQPGLITDLDREQYFAT